MTNTCKTCRFYDKLAPREHLNENYALGFCTIMLDRMPLWAKGCACDTCVHGDWKDCPTWTGDTVIVPDSPSKEA